MMKKTMTIANQGTVTTDECVACVAMKNYGLVEHGPDKCFIAGMMIGIGIEGTKLTPRFCDKHHEVVRTIADVFEEEVKSTMRSMQ